MKILRFLTPLFLLAATAFGQVVLQQPPGTYTDNSIPVRDGTYNKIKNASTLLFTTSANPGEANRTLKIGSNTGDSQLLIVGGSAAGNTANSFNFELHDAGDALTQAHVLGFDLGLSRWYTTYWSTLSSAYVEQSHFDPATNVTTFTNGLSAPVLTSTIATGTAPFIVASTTLVTNLHAATADSSTSTTTATNATNTAITDDTSTNATMYPTWVTAATGNLPQKVSSTKMSFNPSTGLLTSTGVSASSVTDSGLTSGRVTFAGTGGLLADSSALTFSAGTLSATTFSGLMSSAALTLSGVASPSYVQGKLVYDTGNESLTFYNNDSNISLQVGQESWIRVRNDTGSTIANGIPVYISGAASGLPQITPANANALGTSAIVGLTTESISTATSGWVTSSGVVHDFDTSAFSAGARIYLGTTAGTLTATVPTNPNYQVTVGTVIVSNASTGSVMVTPSSGRVAGTLAFTDVANVFTAPQTFTPAARTSGVAPYFTINAPTDTGITAATEGIGVSFPTATRTWATTGTVALQRERFFAGPTYASAGASQTFTDAFNSYFTPPVAGTNAIFTRNHTLGIVDSTSAASSITGGLVVATTLGTTATSVGIGGGNVNAGGLITGGTVTSTGTLTATAALSVGTTSTFTGVATYNNAVVVNGAAGSTALTITNTARTSGVLPYIKYTIPTDTAQTASTESPGIQGVTGTRTWATTGTVALQREIFFPGPTYASASASQTFTDVFNMYLTPPVQGTNAIFTRGHTLGIVDSTSAASSITGGLVVATTLGTTATSVGIGGGNINAGGTGTFGGAVTATTYNGNTLTTGSSTFTGTAAQTYTFPATTSTIFGSTTKADVLEAGLFAADAGANDTYVITLAPAITAYVTGAHYWFKANTANTGAATININGLGAKTIVKAAGGITTTLADNDIRAGQWVDLAYDGTNMQMQSLLGNAPSGSGTVTVVSAGSLTSTALVTGGGSQALQTPSATATMDSSGNISTPGTLTVGNAATTAGAVALTQGTTQSTGTTNITIQAPTSVTSYIRTLPSSVGSTGLVIETVSGSTQTETVGNLTGDITSAGAATTLATVNSNVGSFTNANITVNAKGLITAAANGSGGSGGSALTLSVAQTSHGFTVGQAIYNTTGTTWALSKADNTTTSKVQGVVTTVTDANNFIATLSGAATLSSLTVNTAYYLSDATAGLLTTTKPTATTSYIVQVMTTGSTTVGYVAPQQPTSLALIGTNDINFGLTADTSTSLTVTTAMDYITTSNASTVTATLPTLAAAIAANPTKIYHVKNLGAGSVNYTRSGSDTIFYLSAGQTVITLATGESCDFVATASQWLVL